jgi:sugar/nucleoside kinase (ribokinase family)
VSGSGEVIAVAGEALVDLVLKPDGRTTPHLGGGPFNAARTLGRLGLGPTFIGRLGRDAYGDALGAAWLAAWLSDGLRRADLGNLEAATEAAQFASAVAALTCERAGAEPPNAAKVGAEWCFAQLTSNVPAIGE